MPLIQQIHTFEHEAPDHIIKHLPLILIHGAGGNLLAWPPQIRRLHGQHVYAIDLPGHGQSEGAGRNAIGEYVEDVLAFMQALELKAAIIGGISMGGAIALSLALKYPKRVAGLALLGSGAKLRVAPSILEGLGNTSTFEATVDMINKNCFSSNPPENLLDLSKKAMLETRPAALLGDFMACDQFDMTNKLARIKTPTLIVCGSEDKMTPLKYSKFLYASIADSQLKVLEGAGHMVMAERPAEVAEILEEFINSIPLRTRRKTTPVAKE